MWNKREHDCQRAEEIRGGEEKRRGARKISRTSWYRAQCDARSNVRIYLKGSSIGRMRSTVRRLFHQGAEQGVSNTLSFLADCDSISHLQVDTQQVYVIWVIITSAVPVLFYDFTVNVFHERKQNLLHYCSRVWFIYNDELNCCYFVRHCK